MSGTAGSTDATARRTASDRRIGSIDVRMAKCAAPRNSEGTSGLKTLGLNALRKLSITRTPNDADDHLSVCILRAEGRFAGRLGSDSERSVRTNNSSTTTASESGRMSRGWNARPASDRNLHGRRRNAPSTWFRVVPVADLCRRAVPATVRPGTTTAREVSVSRKQPNLDRAYTRALPESAKAVPSSARHSPPRFPPYIPPARDSLWRKPDSAGRNRHPHFSDCRAFFPRAPPRPAR